MRLIHVSDFRGSYPGSYVPMLRAAVAVARELGWETEVVLPEVARDRPWRALLEADGIAATYVEPYPRRAAQQVLAERVQALAGRVLLHTTFGTYDVAAAAAAETHPRAGLIWHLHSYLAPDLPTRAR